MTIYGQEMDNATAALAKMNMILHGNETAEIRQGQHAHQPALQRDGRQLKTFDFAVANPPFSDQGLEQWLDPATTSIDASTFGIPPEKNGDYAFLLHVITSLKSTGKGAIILPHGVLFRGNAEATIRSEPHPARATSRASSACLRTSSTAPASRPASSCSTRRTPQAAPASS